MIQVYGILIEPDLSQAQFLDLLGCVSPDKQERIRRFRFLKDAQNALVGDVFIRAELCRQTGMRNQALVFSTNPYGKPRLSADLGIHYNISHTANHVAVAVDGEPVGIDIEQIGSADPAIANRFFSPDETEYIFSFPAERQLRFYEIWTQKESYIKREGKGLSIPLPSFSVLAGRGRGTHYHPVHLPVSAICHVCTGQPRTPEVAILATDQFLEYVRVHLRR